MSRNRSNENIREIESNIAEWARHNVVTTTKIGTGKTLTEDNLTTKRLETVSERRNFTSLLINGPLVTWSQTQYHEDRT